MQNHFLPAFLILLLVLNPLACIYALRPDQTVAGGPASNSGNRLLILQTCVWSLFLLLGISLLGQTVIHWFSLSIASVQVSSGLILFLLAISMVFSGSRPSGKDTRSPAEAPSSLLAAAAGPTAMANVLLLSATQQGHWLEMAGALSCAVLVCAALMQACRRLQHHFGFAMAVGGVQKLMGLLLTAIAVDRILTGSHQYFVG